MNLYSLDILNLKTEHKNSIKFFELNANSLNKE